MNEWFWQHRQQGFSSSWPWVRELWIIFTFYFFLLCIFCFQPCAWIIYEWKKPQLWYSYINWASPSFPSCLGNSLYGPSFLCDSSCFRSEAEQRPSRATVCVVVLAPQVHAAPSFIPHLALHYILGELRNSIEWACLTSSSWYWNIISKGPVS